MGARRANEASVERGVNSMLTRCFERATMRDPAQGDTITLTDCEMVYGSDGRWRRARPPSTVAARATQPRSNLTFQEAVKALAGHRPYRLIRRYRDLDDVSHLRELQHSPDGHISVQMDLHAEPRHLTVEDIQATTWQEVIG